MRIHDFRQSQNCKKQIPQRCPSTQLIQEVTQPLAEGVSEPSHLLAPVVGGTSALSEVKMEYSKEKAETLPARARNH